MLILDHLILRSTSATARVPQNQSLRREQKRAPLVAFIATGFNAPSSRDCILFASHVRSVPENFRNTLKFQLEDSFIPASKRDSRNFCILNAEPLPSTEVLNV